jgi:hypothetical protein
MNQFCMATDITKMTKEFAKAYIAYYDAVDNTRFVGNPPCVRDNYNVIYWRAKEVAKEPGTDVMVLLLGIAIAALFVITILILVIVFRSVKNLEPSEVPAEDPLAPAQTQ